MLSFGDATGNLFNRLGKCGVPISQMRLNQASQETNLINGTTGLVAQFNAESDIQSFIGGSYIGQLNSDSIGSLCQNIASRTVNRMIFRDNPQISLSLTQSNTLTCIFEVIRQMKIAGATILAQTIAATVNTVSNPGPHFTGNGTGVIVVSTVRPSDGLILQNAYEETVLALCTNDSYLGGATAGNETITFTGVGSVNLFDFNWPQGSNASLSVSAIDGDSDNTNGNLMTNSGFATFTVANTPDNWTIVTGTAGTNFFSEATIVYSTGSALRFLGDGSTVVNIKQQFDTSSTGTAAELDPLTQYSVCLFMRRDGVAGTGILTVDLVDGGNNVIADANNTANSFTIDLANLSTSYAAFTSTFRTPLILPAQQWIRLRQTTPYSSNRSFYLDKMSMGEMQSHYTHGPYYAVHSGSLNLTQGDYSTCSVTNSRGAAGTLNSFQTLLFRILNDVQSSEIIFPYSATPSIPDSLIG